MMPTWNQYWYEKFFYISGERIFFSLNPQKCDCVYSWYFHPYEAFLFFVGFVTIYFFFSVFENNNKKWSHRIQFALTFSLYRLIPRIFLMSFCEEFFFVNNKMSNIVCLFRKTKRLCLQHIDFKPSISSQPLALAAYVCDISFAAYRF